MSNKAAQTPEKLTRSKFARRLGVYPSYVTKLAHADRLVFTEDNKHVLVEASLVRIKETAAPHRDDVAARHKKNKDAQKNGGQQLEPPKGDESANSYTKNRAKTEFYKAGSAELDYKKKAGELCETAAAHHAAGDVGMITRSTFENLIDQIAPALAAESDEAKVHQLLSEHIERALSDIANRSIAILKKINEV